MSRLQEIFAKMTETADAGTTSAGDIADVRQRLPIGTAERPKKKKKIKNPLYRDAGMLFRALEAMALRETATAGSTNTVDFSNDFGTDTPRIPSETGDLTGDKSWGMWGGTTDITVTTRNPYMDAKEKEEKITPVSVEGAPFHYPLNKDGHDRLLKNKGHYGDSTTRPPVEKSPFDTFVPDGEFILSRKRSDAIEGRAGIKKEKERRKLNKEIQLLAQSNFINSLKGIDITKDAERLDQLVHKIRTHHEKRETEPELNKELDAVGADPSEIS